MGTHSSSLAWDELLTVDGREVASLFYKQGSKTQSKTTIRGYTIPFVGTQQDTRGLFEFLRRQLLKYVFPEEERPPDIDWALARDKFGNCDPKSDGKLGEMLLYVFVEAVLKTPLMAFKLKDLSNPNDQVKGADGVFVGEYQGQLALLIGESKIHQKLSSAILSTVKSLQRFHEDAGPYGNELLIARKYPRERCISGELLSTVMNVLDRKTGILVHPVFVSCDFSAIGEIASLATSQDEAEDLMSKYFQPELETFASTLDSRRGASPQPFQVFLDFFFLPVEDCLRLRKHFYELLHGHSYPSGSPPSSSRKKRKPKRKASE